MPPSMTRRTLMQSAAMAGLATAVGTRAALAEEPLGIALILPSPLGDVGWSHSLAAGLDPVKAAHGDAVKITVLENIAS